MESFGSTVYDLIDVEKHLYNQKIYKNEKLMESSNLFVQEIVLKEKFNVPLSILVKIAKDLKV